MRFSSRQEMAELSDAEYQALVSLHYTMNDLRHEWASANACTDRLAALTNHAEDLDDGARFTHRSKALSRVYSAGYQYVRAVEAQLWPCVSAYAVLAVTLLRRVVDREPPLPDHLVAELAEEPVLADLGAVLAVPARTLLPTRDEHYRAFCQEQLDALRGLLESVYDNLADPGLPTSPGPDRGLARECRLTQADLPNYDPLWEGMLEPLAGLAAQTATEISFHLQHRVELLTS